MILLAHPPSSTRYDLVVWQGSKEFMAACELGGMLQMDFMHKYRMIAILLEKRSR